MPFWFVTVWGCLATVMGAAMIVFRDRVAARVRARAARWGQPRSLFTQSPAWFAVFGAVFAVLGPLAIVGAATGILRTR